MLGILDVSVSEHWVPLIVIKLVVDGDERCILMAPETTVI